MRCNPVTKEQLELARKQNLYIVQFCITGQYRTTRDGGFAVTGAFSKRAAKEFRDFTRKWYEKYIG